MDRLRGRYRRLLWAFPNWYRAERGLEMLTTLLDAAGPGQVRPTARETVDVLWQGWRCRLRAPRGAGCRFVAVIATCAAALACAAAAGGLVVALLAPTPSAAEAVAVAETVMGQRPVNAAGRLFRCSDFCPHVWDRDGDQVVVFDEATYRNNGLDHTTVGYWTASLDRPAVVQRARQRLLADGWSIDGELPSFMVSFQGFTAHRGNLHLRVHPPTTYPGPGVQFTLERQPPPLPLTAAVAAAAAVGLLVGRMTINWALQRYRRHTITVRAVIVLLAVPPLSVLFLIEFFTAPLLVMALPASTKPTGLVPAAAVETVSLYLKLPGAATVAAALVASAALAVTLAALPTPAGRTHRPHPAA